VTGEQDHVLHGTEYVWRNINSSRPAKRLTWMSGTVMWLLQLNSHLSNSLVKI